MPIYEFECTDHGSFELTRPIAQMREPAPCPDCGAHGKRLLSAPNLATGSVVGRKAAAINERSQHEPRIVQRAAPRASDDPGKRTVHSAHGGYPWAIGH
ncbi:MAG TPA: zinc ribbon domain-containing protein [Polyangiaceae bacterium]|nr:zinc ribbon domain-containing protein [Polyangiaceae bacterium]